MIPFGIFEDSLQAALNNDTQQVAKNIDELIQRAKSSNRKGELVKLRELSKNIKPNKTFFAQSTMSATRLDLDMKSTLFDYMHPDETLSDLVLPSPERSRIARLIHEWENSDFLAEHHLYPQNRIILYGPPGTGKSKLARAIANELQLPLVYVRLDELISSYLGKTGKNIREIFSFAERQNVVVFLDEIDTIAKQRDDHQELGELKRVVTVLLQNIDAFPSSSMLIAATNHESLLDSAIWRRFPLRVKTELPAKEERYRLLELFLGKWRYSANLKLISDLMEGLSGSDIEEIVNRSKRAALMNHNEVDDLLIIRSLIEQIPSSDRNKVFRKKLYQFAQKLLNKGYKVQDISEIIGIPYTTLRDNLENKS